MFYKNPCENCFERMFKCRKYNDGVNTCGKKHDYNFKVKNLKYNLQYVVASFVLVLMIMFISIVIKTIAKMMINIF